MKAKRPKLKLHNGGALSAHVAPTPPARDDSELYPRDADVLPRGVYEVKTRIPGVRMFELVAADGRWLKTVQLPTHSATENAMEALWQELNALDPEPTLRLV